MTVHVLVHGVSLCGKGPPWLWGADESWVYLPGEGATCEGCLAPLDTSALRSIWDNKGLSDYEKTRMTVALLMREFGPDREEPKTTPAPPPQTAVWCDRCGMASPPDEHGRAEVYGPSGMLFTSARICRSCIVAVQKSIAGQRRGRGRK